MNSHTIDTLKLLYNNNIYERYKSLTFIKNRKKT